ncbi:hypothetical protein [Streptomyces sp. NPDC001828]|uniref:hypothetical protein n=1 Tax=Streptomyces sp. NPDC001828 TaxID=3364615 RepID=UPI003675EA40
MPPPRHSLPVRIPARSKTEIFYQFGGTAHSSGEVPAATLERLATCFVADEEEFAALARRLRSDRVLVLSGPHFAGRRTAALMLLRRLGAAPLRVLDRTTRPGELAQQLGPGGQVLCDLVTERGRPLRESDLLAARDRLAEHDAYLVVTVDPRAAMEDVSAAEWHPPTPGAVLAAHLRARVSPEDAGKLLALPAVADFLARDHQLREAASAHSSRRPRTPPTWPRSRSSAHTSSSASNAPAPGGTRRRSTPSGGR